MRMSRAETERSHRRIIESAAHMMRERGIAATGIADVMREAGMTHGGFYRHFAGKDDLVVAALDAAFDERITALAARFERMAPEAAVADYQADYLTEMHIEHPEFGCPVPGFGAEVGRGTPEQRAVYGAGVRAGLALLARGMAGTAAEREAAAARKLAMIAGAVLIARASDSETGRMVLEACRQQVEEPATR